MDIDCHSLRRSLVEQLGLLAAPGGKVLANLPDGTLKVEELALDFDTFYRAYARSYPDEIPPGAREPLRAIHEAMSAMSRPSRPELWTEEALVSHPKWAAIRAFAAEALRQFREMSTES